MFKNYQKKPCFRTTKTDIISFGLSYDLFSRYVSEHYVQQNEEKHFDERRGEK